MEHMLQQTPVELFSSFWMQRYPETPPINYFFKSRMPERWARIHSLPLSKRYADTVEEWDILLGRQNAVVDYLITQGTPVRVVIIYIREDNPLFASYDIENIGVFIDRNEETVFQSFWFETTWKTGCLDAMLRMIAVEDVRAFIVGPDCLVAPYDGGVDVILTDTAARDAFKNHFTEWLSAHPHGL
jgi:hypothetical protein